MPTETNELNVGVKYRVTHTRKGRFSIQVTEISGDWVTGVIIDGKTDALIEENKRYKGEAITLRRSLCSFQTIPDGEAKGG